MGFPIMSSQVRVAGEFLGVGVVVSRLIEKINSSRRLVLGYQ